MHKLIIKKIDQHTFQSTSIDLQKYENQFGTTFLYSTYTVRKFHTTFGRYLRLTSRVFLRDSQ